MDPEEIEAITRGSVGLWRAAEQAILRTVTRYLVAGLDTPTWAVARLGALATLRRTVERILTLVEAEGADSIRRTMAEAYRSGSARATTGIPAQLLPRDPDAVRAAAVLAQVPRAGVIENLAGALVRDIGERHSNVLRHVTDVYRQVIAEATSVSVAGGATRRQASQWAYQRLVDQGVTSFTDRSGRRWRLSSYVEMAVRTVTQRAAVQGQTDRLARIGISTVIVSNESQECSRCRPFEGKILRTDAGPVGNVTMSHATKDTPVTVDITATLDHARARGLQHPNCRHSVRAYLPGVTKQPTGPTEDRAGDIARTRQREIERAIRKYKERESAALTPEAKSAARAKARAWQTEMREHLAANPKLKRLPYREAPGAGNVPRSGVLPPADRPLNLP